MKIHGNEKIPSTMQAVFPETPGGPLVVRITDVPLPGDGEVLVKMLASPVNPSDLGALRKAGNDPGVTGYIPGLEGSGLVVAAGKGLLPGLWLGKRVACSAHTPGKGTWAQYMVTSAATCFPLRKDIGDEQGSMTLVNPLTAISFIEKVKKSGQRSFINNAAASSLGRMIEYLASKEGLTVINLVRSDEKVAMLLNAGSTHVLNTSSEDFTEKLATMANSLNSKILFDSVCDDNLPSIVSSLPYGSEVVIYGNLTATEGISINPRDLIDRDIKVTGFFLGNQAKENGLLKNMVNLIKAGKLMSTGLPVKISGRYPLARVQEAVTVYLDHMSDGKVLLIP
ncbi:MAG: zinc-binding dehydrogenase [Bacteroidales bacterium]